MALVSFRMLKFQNIRDFDGFQLKIIIHSISINSFRLKIIKENVIQTARNSFDGCVQRRSDSWTVDVTATQTILIVMVVHCAV